MLPQQVFECPYAKMPLHRACEVSSCSFNLPEASPLSRYYKRCFLNYVEKGVQNPNHLACIEQAQFSKLSVTQKKSLLKAFFQAKDDDLDHAQRTFYLSFFSIVLQDLLLEIPRGTLQPVAYEQCVVCGVSCEESERAFFFPKGGALPSGQGYCSWSCYQLKPPPIIVLERILDVDFKHIVGHDELQHALKQESVSLITYWLFTGVPLT